MTRSEVDLAATAGLELIASRRSIRRYVAGELDPRIVEQVLCAGAWAPSAHNRQPWRFVLIEKTGCKQRLARAMGERLRADRLADGDDPVTVTRDVERSFARITSAPLAILVCLSMEDMDRYPDTRRQQAEHMMAIQSTAMAMQNLLLAGHALGLGTSIMCAPLFCASTVTATLALPQGWEPQGLIIMGIPADRGKAAVRRPMAEVVRRPSDVSV